MNKYKIITPQKIYEEWNDIPQEDNIVNSTINNVIKKINAITNYKYNSVFQYNYIDDEGNTIAIINIDRDTNSPEYRNDNQCSALFDAVSLCCKDNLDNNNDNSHSNYSYSGFGQSISVSKSQIEISNEVKQLLEAAKVLSEVSFGNNKQCFNNHPLPPDYLEFPPFDLSMWFYEKQQSDLRYVKKLGYDVSLTGWMLTIQDNGVATFMNPAEVFNVALQDYVMYVDMYNYLDGNYYNKQQSDSRYQQIEQNKAIIIGNSYNNVIFGRILTTNYIAQDKNNNRLLGNWNLLNQIEGITINANGDLTIDDTNSQIGIGNYTISINFEPVDKTILPNNKDVLIIISENPQVQSIGANTFSTDLKIDLEIGNLTDITLASLTSYNSTQLTPQVGDIVNDSLAVGIITSIDSLNAIVKTIAAKYIETPTKVFSGSNTIPENNSITIDLGENDLITLRANPINGSSTRYAWNFNFRTYITKNTIEYIIEGRTSNPVDSNSGYDFIYNFSNNDNLEIISIYLTETYNFVSVLSNYQLWVRRMESGYTEMPKVVFKRFLNTQ